MVWTNWSEQHAGVAGHRRQETQDAGRWAGWAGWMLLDFVGSWEPAEADWLGGGVYGWRAWADGLGAWCPSLSGPAQSSPLTPASPPLGAVACPSASFPALGLANPAPSPTSSHRAALHALRRPSA